MIGYITTPETATAVTEAIREAQTSRNLPVFWLLAGVPILRGPHVGLHFIPADNEVLATPLRGNPVLTPQDFPEFNTIINQLGGLEARIEVPLTDILNTDSEP